MPPSYQTVYGANGHTLTGLPWALPAAAPVARAAERLPEPLPPAAQSVRPGRGSPGTAKASATPQRLTDRLRRVMATKALREETLMLKRIAEFLTLKWLWDRR